MHGVGADPAREAKPASRLHVRLGEHAGIRARRVFDRRGCLRRGNSARQVVGHDRVGGLEPVAAVEVRAELESRAPKRAVRGRTKLKLTRLDLRLFEASGPRRRRQSILIGLLTERSHEAIEPNAIEPGQRSASVRHGQPMGVFGRGRHPDNVRIAAGTPDVPTAVGLPSDRPVGGRRGVLPSQPGAVIAPTGVRHWTGRRVVAVEVPGAYAGENRAASVAGGYFQIAAGFGESAAKCARESSLQRPRVIGPPRSHGDHAAHRVGTICDRCRTACDLHAFESGGIQKRCVRSGASFAGRAVAVHHDRRPAAGEAANRRRGRLALRDDADARNVLENLTEGHRMPDADVRGREQRRRCPGRNIDRRGRAGDIYGFCNGGFDKKSDPARFVERRHVHRPRHEALRQDDHEHEWRLDGQCPLESAVRSGPRGSALADDGDVGVRDRGAGASVNDLSAERQRGCGDRESEKKERASASQHAGQSTSEESADMRSAVLCYSSLTSGDTT